MYIFAFIFCIVPYLVQFGAAIYCIHKWKHWKQDNPIRLIDYFKHYECIVYLLSIFGTFYRAIDICQSKIFYLQMFHLQLRKKELNAIKHFRFVNIVVFEVCLSLICLI